MQDRVVGVAKDLERPGQAVIGTDTAGIIVYWGPGAARLYGWSRAEVLGQNIVGLTAAEMSAKEAARIMRTLRSGRPWSGEFLVRTRAGRRFLAYVQDLPVRDDDGRMVGIVGVSRRAAYMGEASRRPTPRA